MEIKLDQHFLSDKEVLSKIVETIDINPEDIIFEIGPGHGVLTKEILNQKPKKLIVCELDESLIQKLKSLISSPHSLILGNALDEIPNSTFTKLVGNIPYAITEPLYEQILDLKIPFVVLMHGKRFYEQYASKQTNKWHYFINAFYDVEKICKVPGTSFKPKTKVDSVVVKLTPKENITEEDKFFQFLFEKRDRICKNALLFSLVDSKKISKKDAKQQLEEMELRKEILDKRVKNLSNNEFINILTRIL
ncbi:MAG: ribosomal RNA small subunit methyltransferase A [Nanoarchaeota archaeon]